jgi:hypothetical protein
MEDDLLPAPIAWGAQPLNVVFFAETSLDDIDEATIDILDSCDLVVGLGHVSLQRLVEHMPANKPALCVLGPNDPAQPPAPFRRLHANGVNFHDWRIAGFGGAPRRSRAEGFYVSEPEALGLLSDLPACDVLLSYAPPPGLETMRFAPQATFPPLGAYITDKPPIYHFYAHPRENVAESLDEALVVGVHGMLYPPALVFH